MGIFLKEGSVIPMAILGKNLNDTIKPREFKGYYSDRQKWEITY